MTYQNEEAGEKRQDEKAEEKRLEKEEDQEEKLEKGWDWQRDSLSGAIWALILIWAGVLLLFVQLDLAFLGWLNWGNVWGAILFGAALLLGLESAVRLRVPAYTRPIRGRIILAAILAILGISQFTDVPLWPLIMIAVGVGILVQVLTQR